MYSLFTLAFALEPFVPRCRAAATVVVSASYFELDDISNRILRRAQDDADSNTGPSDSNVALIAACTTSGILILVCVIILLWFYRRRQRLNRPPRESIDGLMRSSIHVEELKQQYDLPISHAVVTIPRAALPRSDNASEIDKGQYWRGRPQKLVSAAGPPPRGLLASESSGTIRSITPRPHEQTISWVSDQQRSPVRAVELDFNPYRDPNDLGWSGGAEGTPRLRYVSAHPLPHLPPAALQAGTSPGTSHVSHSTHSRSFSSSAAHPHFKFVAPPSSRGTSTQAVAELAIQPPSESQSPASLNPTPTAAATPGHLPLSAATPRWPRFGFASGVPDDSEESPHTATTNATAYDWRRSEYVPTRQRTLTGPRDRRTQASTAKRQRTLSQPESLFSVYVAHGHGLEKDKPMSPSLPVISATPIPALPSIPIPGVPFPFVASRPSTEEVPAPMAAEQWTDVRIRPVQSAIGERQLPALRVDTGMAPAPPAPPALVEKPGRERSSRAPSGPRLRPKSGARPKSALRPVSTRTQSVVGPLVVQNAVNL